MVAVEKNPEHFRRNIGIYTILTFGLVEWETKKGEIFFVGSKGDFISEDISEYIWGCHGDGECKQGTCIHPHNHHDIFTYILLV